MGVWVRPLADGVPDGVKGPRLANGSWEHQGYKRLEKRRRRVINRGWRCSYILELTTFDEGFDVRDRLHGAPRNVCEVGDWVGACRGGENEGAGL